MDLQLIEIMAMVLAAWRMTELMTLDKISEPLRKRLPLYVFTCSRCMSVWAGITAVLLWKFAPLLNWPLAVSQVYILAQIPLVIIDRAVQQKAKAVGVREITIGVDGSGNINLKHDGFDAATIEQLMARVSSAMRDKEKANGRA